MKKINLQANKTTLLAALLVLVITASVAYAVPSAIPPSSNVNANFNSLTVSGTGAYVQLPKGPKTSGTFGYWVKNTTGSYAGNLSPNATTGYAAAQLLCNAAYADSHVCSAKEIINSMEYYRSGTPTYNIPVLPTTGNAWINNGPPAYISDLSNDCNGWTTNEPSTLGYSVYGSTWKFDKKTSLISHCSRSLPIACCSY